MGLKNIQLYLNIYNHLYIQQVSTPAFFFGFLSLSEPQEESKITVEDHRGKGGNKRSSHGWMEIHQNNDFWTVKML